MPCRAAPRWMPSSSFSARPTPRRSIARCRCTPTSSNASTTSPSDTRSDAAIRNSPFPISPADRLTGQLLIKPGRERGEVIEDGGGVHLLRSGERVERLGPRLRQAHRQHRVQALAGRLALEGRAAVERERAAGDLRQRAVTLELQDAGEEVARVRGVVGHVILRAGIEELLAARRRRRDALILQAQIPPRLVVVLRLDLAGKHLPPPLVDEQAEREERDLLERLVHEEPEIARRV